MNSLYSKKVLDHFKNPKNMGEIKNPDGVATVGNPVCGDVMKLYIKVKEQKTGKLKNKKIIKDIKFQTLGCAAAIATSSVITTLAKGKTLSKAKKISKKTIASKLGGLPKIKIHCSLLAVDALNQAIKNYQKNNENH
jgi:nitrogen fixation protein NifU and related proteins